MLGLVVFSALLAPALTLAAPGQAASDPCAAIAGQTFADPALVIACQKSFPFSEKLRQNVMTVVSLFFVVVLWYSKCRVVEQDWTRKGRSLVDQIFVQVWLS